MRKQTNQQTVTTTTTTKNAIYYSLNFCDTIHIFSWYIKYQDFMTLNVKRGFLWVDLSNIYYERNDMKEKCLCIDSFNGRIYHRCVLDG